MLVAGIGGAVVLLAACSSSSTSTEASGSAAPSASGSASADALGVIDPSTLPVTIPFTAPANHIVVDTGFGTADTFPMMLDTGAPLNVSADLVKQFAFPVIDKMDAAAAGGTVTSDVVGVDKVTLGGLSVAQVAGISPWVDDANPLSCITENGLVGANVMKNAVWQIDYQAKTVTVTASTDGIDHVTGAIPVPMQAIQGIGGSPAVAFGVGDDGLGVLVDTGSDGGILAGPKDLAKVGVDVPKGAPVVKSRVAGAAGSVDFDIPYVTTTIDLGTTKIEYPIGAAEVVSGIGNIGNAFLSQFVVTFDFPNNTMYLDPISGDGTIADPPIPGASVGWDGKTAIVRGVAVGSAADEAGLKLGDVVTEVDGTPITTRDAFCAAVTGPQISTITTKAGTFDAGLVDNFFTTG
jgi:hypothetical protein